MRYRPHRFVGFWPLVVILSIQPSEDPTQEPQDETVLGKGSGWSLEEAQEQIWLEAEMRLFETPDLRTPPLEVIDNRALVPVLERRGPWARVRYRYWKAWVYLGDPRHIDLQLPTEPFPSSGPDKKKLERAREILGDAGRTVALGQFTLLTDVGKEGLIAGLAGTVESLQEAYFERFGLQPAPAQDEMIVLFSSASQYASYTDEETAIADLHTHGHMSQGLAVTFVGGRVPDEVRQLVIHELTHVLNRRIFGPRLPPWLEEGLAEDLAISRFDRTGRIVVGTLGGTSRSEGSLVTAGNTRVFPGQISLTGGRSALIGLLFYWRDPSRPTLSQLADMPWGNFVQPGPRKHHYAQSAFLIRFLLDADKESRSELFQDFLKKAAVGEPAFRESLEEHLGSPLDSFEDEFYLWIRRLATAEGFPTPGQ